MSVTAAAAFEACGVECGIRRSRRDLALVRSVVPAVGAGMFTTNRVQAAPITVSRAHLAAAAPQAVVVNSGVANAATGERGQIDALAMASETARLLDLRVEQVLVLSTGVIGVHLPLGKVRSGLAAAAVALSPHGGPDAADAILTTDTRPKEAVAERGGFAVGGMAKGSGMIHPALATMLAVVTTDYPLEPGEAEAFLRPAVESTFNRISVDGDCSTNDAVLLLANGASGAAPDERAFADALQEVCASLARQIVEDGEGRTVLIEVRVARAADEREAAAVARRVATSPLVKTAAFGRDPNWGRVLAAAGSAPMNGGFAQLDPGALRLSFNGTLVFAAGRPVDARPDMDGASLVIDLELGIGSGSAAYLASDLTYDYVRLNTEYTT